MQPVPRRSGHHAGLDNAPQQTLDERTPKLEITNAIKGSLVTTSGKVWLHLSREKKIKTVKTSRTTNLNRDISREVGMFRKPRANILVQFSRMHQFSVIFQNHRKLFFHIFHDTIPRVSAWRRCPHVGEKPRHRRCKPTFCRACTDS